MQPSQEGVRPLILLIENDEADIFLFRRALSKMGFQGDLRVVGSVSEARAYMENTGTFTDTNYYRTPDLIVSDFRLSGPTALEFIRWLRNTKFSALPVVIFSGTVRPSELPRLNEMGVKEVIYKNPDVTLLAARLEAMLPHVLMGLFTIGIVSYAA
ncbi:MAG TPA: response regulator [Candidatus Limnocylindria bacterium]|nr:response regulator [Candidatus Limnocylindria bacterium]